MGLPTATRIAIKRQRSGTECLQIHQLEELHRADQGHPQQGTAHVTEKNVSLLGTGFHVADGPVKLLPMEWVAGKSAV